MLDVDRLARRVAGHGLPGAEPPAVAAPVDDDLWESLLGRCGAGRVTPQLAAAVAEGSVAATETQMASLRDAQERAMRQALVVESALLRAMAHLEGAAVEIRVLKGVAVAHLDHPNAADRAYNDVDLLVRPSDLDRAIRTLVDAGADRDLPPRTRSWDRRFSKDVCLVEERGVELDLHRTIAPGAYGFRIPLADLWAEPQLFEVGGRRIPALGRERRVLHAVFSLTVAEADPRLATGRDLALALSPSRLDLDGLIRRARRWRCDDLLAEAIELVGGWFGPQTLPPVLVAWASTFTPGRRQRRARAAYRSAGGTNAATLLAGARGLPWHARPAYLRGLVLPSRAYRAARRSSGRPSEWRTGARELSGRAKR